MSFHKSKNKATNFFLNIKKILTKIITFVTWLKIIDIDKDLLVMYVSNPQELVWFVNDNKVEYLSLILNYVITNIVQWYRKLAYEGHSINKVNLATGVSNKEALFASFSRKLKMLVFHVSEHYQHDLLYWLLHLEPFLYRRVSVFPHHGLSFWLKLVSVNPHLAYL